MPTRASTWSTGLLNSMRPLTLPTPAPRRISRSALPVCNHTPSCVICLEPDDLIRAQSLTSHAHCASSATWSHSSLSEHSLTHINRHQRLQNLQRTSNLYRLRTHQHNRPRHPAIRQQRQERLPPLPQGRDAQERLRGVLNNRPKRDLDAPRRQRRLHPRADRGPRGVLGQQGRGQGEPAG